MSMPDRNTRRVRLQERLRTRAAKMPEITTLWLHGLASVSRVRLRYEWDGSLDLDTGTTFLGGTVGYAQANGYQTARMIHYGDITTSSGYELVDIDVEGAAMAGELTGEVTITCMADWYPPQGGSGPARLLIDMDGAVTEVAISPGTTATPATTVVHTITVRGPLKLLKTPTGEWSSDGTDMIPATGEWYCLVRTVTTVQQAEETIGGELPTKTTASRVVAWWAQRWVDGVLDTGFSWRTEDLWETQAQDIFAFDVWRQESTDFDPLKSIWLEAVEPELPASADINEWLDVLNESYFSDILRGGAASTTYQRHVTGGNALSQF